MRTVLHVEPSEFFTEMIRGLLKEKDYEYICTDSYNEALLLLEEYDIDLILLSLEGNGMRCEDFVKNVSYTFNEMPICVVSGNKLNANMQHFMNLGVIQYVDKEEIKEGLVKYIDGIFKPDEYLDILRMLSIAVIEDSHFSRLHLKEIFDLYKIKHVKYFASGAELIEDSKKFDVYLVDLVLKDEFGKNIIASIREKNENALIFAVTSLNNPKLLSDVLDNGADDIINKPVEDKVFISKLKSHIRRLKK